MDRVVNIFNKGLIRDVDPLYIPEGRFTDAKSIRVYTKDGKSYIVSNIRGNSETFHVTTGFTPIGFVVHRGILFILSAKDDYSGVGEIGSYPSPSCTTVSSHTNCEFKSVYKPLQNFGGSSMRTDILKFYPDRRIDVQSKSYYDSSVNLYLVDGNNVARVINCGFKDDGSTGGISYSATSFDTLSSLILYNKSAQSISDFSVSGGGKLKPGMYTFYIRHETSNYDGTVFADVPQPVPVFNGSEASKTMEGGDAKDVTDKMVSLDLEDIDTDYDYLVVAYKRSFSDFGGLPVDEFGIINRRFKITGSSMTIDITGFEGERLVDESELEMKPFDESIPKSIRVLDNRLWGANWKRKEVDNDALKNFAALIDTSYVKHYAPATTTPGINGSFRNVSEYKYIGYFLGEPYPFGVVFQLTDGTFTKAYPVKGNDYFSSTSSPTSNTKGIVRFPSPRLEPVYAVNRLTTFGVEFDLSSAVASIVGSGANTWIRTHVKAIHFVRGDRIKNLQAQGLMISACQAYADDDMSYVVSLNSSTYLDKQEDTSASIKYAPVLLNPATGAADTFWGNKGSSSNGRFTAWNNTKKAPIWRGYLPFFQHDSTITSTSNHSNFMGRVFAQHNYYGFYSPELLFNDINNIAEYNYIYSLGKTVEATRPGTGVNTGRWTIEDEASKDASGYYSRYPYWQRASVGISAALITTGMRTGIEQILNKVMVGESQLIMPGNDGYNDFINAADEPYSSPENTWAWNNADDDPYSSDHHVHNRAFVLAKYLGIEVDNDTDSSNFNLDLVNIYRDNPTSITVADLSNDGPFFKIGDPLYISDLVDDYAAGTLGAVSIFDGDCYTDYFYFRQAQWGGSKFLFGLDSSDFKAWDDIDAVDKPSPGTGDISIDFSSGLIIGFPVQTSIDVSLRSNFEDNSFWPFKEDLWAVEPYNKGQESFAYNKGFSVITTKNFFPKYDPDTPLSTIDFLTRIRYSDKDIYGGIADPFRSWRAANYKDFDAKNGEIIAIGIVNDRLVSVQEDAINEHFINERITLNADEGVIYGSGDVLSEKALQISTFGSQHQFSIVSTETGLYGVDWKRGIIWLVKPQYSSTGRIFLAAVDLTEKHMIKGFMKDLLDEFFSGHTSKSYIYPDKTVVGKGIASGYDIGLGDVYFNFLFKK